MAGANTNQYLTRRPMVLGLAKILFLCLSQVPFIQAAPFHPSRIWTQDENMEPAPVEGASLWLYLGVGAALVLAGGAFAGLTIALMGQDEIYLQVIRDSGEGPEVKHADKVLNLLHKGKHWVLVTLLLSNVITNETLPIVLDRSLGGGWPAVLGSTVLIVIFGEIVPQSICVRYGLPIGAWMSPFVLALMYIMAPVAWPTAKLLDFLLGEDHGTVYKKAGLKTLVSLHRSMGEAGQRLHADEVTIISAVLDLKEKTVGSIMTPMDDVFTLSLDDVLDEPTMDDILSQGYSRIPIHAPDDEENFVGMLLVKMLITYDPEDAKPVRDFALATLPETRPDTSCLDIVNFFQEGKSHMVLVSENPGEDHGALGVVTLEDVIEELIGEEIIDESDVYVDIHKAIRRLNPAPRTKFPRMAVTGNAMNAITPRVSNAGLQANAPLIDITEDEALDTKDLARQGANEGDAVKKEHPIVHRRLSTTSNEETKALKRRNVDDVREQLKHLGPSNLASRPKATRYASVKIKPGSEVNVASPSQNPLEGGRLVRRVSQPASDYANGIGEGVVVSGGRPASDGVQALTQGYGSISDSPNDRRPHSSSKSMKSLSNGKAGATSPREERQGLVSRPTLETMHSEDTITDLPDHSQPKSPYYRSRGPARSGSITENIIDTNGFRKVVLETTSSSSDDDNTSSGKGDKSPSGRRSDESQTSSPKLQQDSDHAANEDHDTSKKKKRRKRRGKSNKSEEQPLLDEQ